ncbi:ParB N-terminal domain-containing protein [Amorphus sp. 3PC139-8]
MSKEQYDQGVSAKLVSIDDLTPNPQNARKHPASQVASIRASISEYGFTNPILADIDDGGLIVAGHGRRLALLELFAAGEAVRLPNGRTLPDRMVPVIDCAGWTEGQRRAYTIADNRLAETSTWDKGLLKVELAFLNDEGFDLDLTGFEGKALDKMLAETTPPDEFPEYGDDIETDHQCPRCGYRWSGKAG